MNPKKILIVCYTFPPSPGIGGRRWAKFAKYLHRAGHDVHIIKAKNGSEERSQWEKDIEGLKDKIQELPRKYPQVLDHAPKTLMAKLQYRLALSLLKLVTKGNYFDRSIRWGGALRKAVEKKVQEGFNNIIVATPPFHSIYSLRSLRSRYPDIQLMVDIRDLWTDNKNAYGFISLSRKRLELEKKKERESVRFSDRVLVVNRTFQKHFRSLVDDDPKKVLLVPNGYDKEDITLHQELAPPDDQWRMIFIGNFPRNSIHLMKELRDSLVAMKTSDPELYRDFKLDLYGSVPEGFSEALPPDGKVEFHGRRPLSEIQKELNRVHAGALFQTDGGRFNFITKFYEYLGHELPIIVFSKPGETGRYVEEHDLGHACFTGEMEEKLRKAYKSWREGKLQLSPDLDIGKFEVERIVHDQLETILQPPSKE